VWSWGEATGVPSDFSGGFLTGIFEMISKKMKMLPKIIS
jgi:hypothetical protein